MTNPFLANNAAPAAPQTEAPVQNTAPAPQTQAAPPAQSSAPAGFATPATTGQTAGAADPFGRPSGPGGAQIKDDLDQGLLLRPIQFRPQVPTSLPTGPKDAVETDWIVLTGPNQGQVRQGSLVFNGPLVRELKRALDTAGQKFVVGVLVWGEKKPGQNAPLILAEPNDEVMALAQQAAAAHNWI